MVLLIRMKIDPVRTMEAVAATFKKRAKHEVPADLEPPPVEWDKPYAALAKECKLTETLNQAFAMVDDFFKHNLRGG